MFVLLDSNAPEPSSPVHCSLLGVHFLKVCVGSIPNSLTRQGPNSFLSLILWVNEDARISVSHVALC